MKCTAFFLLLLGSLTCMSTAQNPYNFPFRKYQVNDGLSENTVTSILQDRKGFIWVGTKDGLNKFDGTDFTTYRKQNSKHALQNNYVTSIVEGKGDELYVGTDDGVYIMDRRDNSFTRLEKTLNAGGKLMTAVNHIMLDSQERLWIGCNLDGVFRYDIRKAELKRIQCAGYDLTRTNVWTVLEDRSGSIWVGTRIGLLQYNPAQDRLEPVQDLCNPDNSNSSEKEILSIFEDPKGNLWLGTWGEGIFFYNKQRKGYTAFCGPDSGKHYITHIRTFLQYDDNHMLVGADDGLYMFGMESKKTTRIDTPYNPHSLSDQNVYSLLRDHEGGIWVGTYFGGLNYLSPNIQSIETYRPDDRPGELSGKAISQFCEAPDGKLWIATEDGGLNLFDPKTQTFTQPVKTSYHNTHALMMVGDELWIGTFSRGIDIYNTKTKKYRYYRHNPDDPHSINDDCVFSLYQAKNDGSIYVGTTRGLNLYEPENDRFVQLRPDSIPFVYDIKEDAYDNLWIASYSQGAIRYNYKSGKWTFYGNLLDEDDPMVGSKLTGIHLDNQRRLWFSSEGRGIFRYDYETDRFTNLSEKDGLPNDVVYGILDDQFGNLWVSSNAGLASFNPSNMNTLKSYTQDDGLQSNEFNYKSSFKSADGKFYFGGINGFNAFYPQELTTHINTAVPNIEITNLQPLGNHDDDIARHILTCINDKQPLKLKHKNSSFTISYTCLSYVAQAKNQYAYKLEGIDTEWNLVGNNKSVTYVDLPAGKYLFKVKASNNNNIWNEEGAELQFEILPPLWLSLPAKIFYSLAIVSLLFFVMYYIAHQAAKNQRQQLDTYKTQQERLAFKSKIDFFTNIAHEIRTPVSLIKAPLEEIILSGDGNSNTKQNLSIIAKNSERLHTLINQLLDFRKIDSVQYAINARQIDLIKYLNELYERFHKTAQSNKLNLRLLLPKEKSIQINFDTDALTKIVGNFLTNAMKHAKSEIELRLETEAGGGYAISVTDDGQGVPDEMKGHLFDPFFQIKSYDNKQGVGIGLSLAKHLSDSLKGNIQITDNPKGGAVFTFRFKTLPEHADEYETGNNEQPAAGLESELDPTAEKRHHVLVVEDNPEMSQFIKNCLNADYKVDTAENAALSLELIASTAYDIIITDIMLPETDGLELTRQIRRNVNCSHIPIILLSAKTDNNTKIEGLNAGGDVFIEKPFSTQYLKAQIASLLANRKAIIDMFNKSPLTSYSILTSNKSDMDFINRLNEEINKNISDSDFTIESLTDKLFISRSNLQRKLKSLCGYTPGEYLRTYRLKKAAQLLLEDGMRINEVSYEMGFSSPSYFTKCFVKQFGMLPKDFVKQNNGETPNRDMEAERNESPNKPEAPHEEVS